LKLKYDRALSSFAFNFSLRHCSEAEVGNVKVCPALGVARVGRDEVQVHWSAGALPTDIDKRDGWRLAIDVVPVAGPGESAPDVVGTDARYNFPRLALASCLSLKPLESELDPTYHKVRQTT
jgi:hypothetical protein